MNDIGFEGIRFDFSKGYAGKYAGQYARSALASDQIAIGEFWVPLKYDEDIMRRDQDDNRQQLAEWLDDGGNRCLAFDFSTKGLLQVSSSSAFIGMLYRTIAKCWFRFLNFQV